MDMLVKTSNTINKTTLEEAKTYCLKFEEFKTSLNSPTGNFFYDNWVIKEQFKGTVWEKLLSSLPHEHGEARVIILKNGINYQSHADIDDRFHLNLQSNQAYLIDLDNKQMFDTVPDLHWYEMDAGRLHTAANFGEIDRIQLVVRKLLTHNQLNDAVTVKIICIDEHLARYAFDNSVSGWLNRQNKVGTISHFSVEKNGHVNFSIERNLLADLKEILPTQFILEVQ